MNIEEHLSDEAILSELGGRLAGRRIDMQLTQADLAHEAGVSKRTIERMENGASTQMISVLRVCRVLDLMGGLDQWLPQTGVRPMDVIKRKGKVRQRVSSKRKDKQADNTWTWDT